MADVLIQVRIDEDNLRTFSVTDLRAAASEEISKAGFALFRRGDGTYRIFLAKGAPSPVTVDEDCSQ